MTPEERDELAELCADACATEGGERLWSALITDCLMGRIVAQHPDPGGLADELGPAKIVDVARRELADLTDAEKEELASVAGGELRLVVASIARSALRAKNGLLDWDDVTPDFIIHAAALAVVANAKR